MYVNIGQLCTSLTVAMAKVKNSRRALLTGCSSLTGAMLDIYTYIYIHIYIYTHVYIYIHICIYIIV